jgi:5S rRNA maturation endonuclease (ribonuclease M5)
MENLEQILNSIGYTSLKDLGLEYQTTPLYRDSNNATALVIRKSDGVFYDFVEKIGGSLAYLIQLTLKTTPEDVQKILQNNNVVIEEKNSNYTSLITQQKTFDKSMLSKLLRDHSYWINRGISEKVIEEFEGGITWNGRMAGRYVIPIYNYQNEIVGFSGRLLKDNKDFSKWKHIGTKSQWVFPAKLNKNIIAKKREVILVESIGDLLSLWEIGIKNIICLFGTDLNSKVIEFMLKLDVKRIIIALNDDSHNNFVGNRAAEGIRLQLINYFDSNQIEIIFPLYNDYNEWLQKNKEGFIEFSKNNNLI